MDPQVPQQQIPDQPMPESMTMPASSGGGGGSKVWMIVAIIAIIALIGGGVYAYTKMTAYNANVASLNTELTASKAQTATLQAEAATNTILKITEFGIQMPKPTDADEAFYGINKNTEGTEVASFTSPALQALAFANPSAPAVVNACGINSAPLGTITKNKAGTLVKGVKIEELKDTDVLIVKKQDVFYYTYAAPTAQCSTVKLVQELQTKQAKSLQESFKNITASK